MLLSRPDFGAFDSALERGADLERRVARYLAQQGYDVETNVVATGRSGGRHEVDVVATRRGGMLTFRVMVECKHHASPVTKDVVAKTRLVRDDCGFDKAMVVCPSGFALGAEQQARDLGIELWDGRELQFVAAGAPLPLVSGPGIRHSSDEAKIERWAHSQRRGIFQREQLVGAVRAFVECHLFDLDYTVTTGGRFSRRIEMHRTHHVYDGIEGNALFGFDSFEFEEGLASPFVLRSTVRRSRLARTLESAFAREQARLESVLEWEAGIRREAAAERARTTLESLGLRTDAHSLAVGEARTFFLPVAIAVYRSNTGERAAAWCDLLDGELPALSAILTRHLHLVRPWLT